jgi:hypothetical protein
MKPETIEDLKRELENLKADVVTAKQLTERNRIATMRLGKAVQHLAAAAKEESRQT